MCACASDSTTTTRCYATSVITSMVSSTSTRTITDQDDEKPGIQGAAYKYGVGILVGIVTAVFVAAIAL